jgi:5-methyltetrahydropteroyltriglutamate--homocysteine methyltransferase
MEEKMSILTHNLGFPRIGGHRELKKATESFWKGDLSSADLLQIAAGIRRDNWKLQKARGIDLIPSNDFSLYDQMLDMCCVLGAVPDRFGGTDAEVGLDTYFAMARGRQGEGAADRADPLEMTKWFDTNYHYLVPEFHRGQTFRLSFSKPLAEYAEAKEWGIETKSVLIGPLSFLLLGKEKEKGIDRLSLLPALLPVYGELLSRLASLGATWVQMDEPCLTMDLSSGQKEAFRSAYRELARSAPGLRLLIVTYFGPLGENLELLFSLPAAGYHLDLVNGGEELEPALDLLPSPASLSLGVVNGRNIWRNGYQGSLALLQKAREKLGSERLMVAPSCSLLHVPVTLSNEPDLEPGLKGMLAFAEEKLEEVAELAALADGRGQDSRVETNRRLHEAWQASPGIQNPQVRARIAGIQAEAIHRPSGFAERHKAQMASLQLPLFPTTTIGSFPQTGDIRAARRKFRNGELTRDAYESFIGERVGRLIREQEELGLDVLVHGEFERTDMVEYFALFLDGYAFTANGWVQSYGSRCVKPPIVYGDVQRPEPITVRWITLAQSLTSRPVKGMLTGPITMLRWSFVREDQPAFETARQIALAMRDEVHDLEAAGIRVIQIDEPALREGLPIKKGAWEAYLQWAVDAFRLASCGVADKTQIHTHMCYSEFDDIFDAIIALDADVLAIEASRSQMELLDTFEQRNYPNQVGPGIYDVHSPRVPETHEIVALLEKACRVLPVENIWVNPDCGLKTRGEPEARAALKNMVEAARIMRSRHGDKRSA